MAPRGLRSDSSSSENAITAEEAIAFQSAVPHHGSGVSFHYGSRHSHAKSNSGSVTEAHGLLNGPNNHCEYRATETPNNLFEYTGSQTFYFADPPIQGATISEAPAERKKPLHIPIWASVPETLEKRRREWIQGLVIDGLLIGISIPFFLLAGIVLQVDNMAVDDHDFHILEQGIKYGATFFPLFFSFIVGRAVIKLSSWKLERGTTLGLLESLMGSRTAFGTVLTQIRLWPLTFTGIGLILLWSLSPLGSQAILRMLSTHQMVTSSTSSATYINTRQPSYSGNPAFQDSWFAGFSSLFSASLLAPTNVKLGFMDLWGNVKIPLSSSLEDVPLDQNGWQVIPQDHTSITYSSLFGISISAPIGGNITFSVESDYMEVNCFNRTSTQARIYETNSTQVGIFFDPGLISTSGPFRSALNVTADTPWALGYYGADFESSLPTSEVSSPAQCLDCFPTQSADQTIGLGLFLYQDFEGAHNVTSIFCDTSQVYVESNVLCTADQSCAVISQRSSTLPHQPTDLTLLSLSTVLNGLTELLPSATSRSTGVDIMQNYLVSPLDNAFIQSAQIPRLSVTPENSNTSTPETESRLLNVPLEDFSTRMTQILNAYLQGSTLNSTSYLTDAVLPPTAEIASSSSLLTLQITNPAIMVPATYTSYHIVYQTSFPWAIISLISTAALLFAALAAAIFSRLTLTCDYLPYVSSMLRESQFSSFQRGGMGWDGLSKTRGCKDLKVRLGDVGDVGAGWTVGTGVALPVGRVQMGDWDEKDWGVERVRSGKLYI